MDGLMNNNNWKAQERRRSKTHQLESKQPKAKMPCKQNVNPLSVCWRMPRKYKSGQSTWTDVSDLAMATNLGLQINWI